VISLPVIDLEVVKAGNPGQPCLNGKAGICGTPSSCKTSTVTVAFSLFRAHADYLIILAFSSSGRAWALWGNLGYFMHARVHSVVFMYAWSLACSLLSWRLRTRCRKLFASAARMPRLFDKLPRPKCFACLLQRLHP
jgi:hypothetical protein